MHTHTTIYCKQVSVLLLFDLTHNTHLFYIICLCHMQLHTIVQYVKSLSSSSFASPHSLLSQALLHLQPQVLGDLLMAKDIDFERKVVQVRNHEQSRCPNAHPALCVVRVMRRACRVSCCHPDDPVRLTTSRPGKIIESWPMCTQRSLPSSTGAQDEVERPTRWTSSSRRYHLSPSPSVLPAPTLLYPHSRAGRSNMAHTKRPTGALGLMGWRGALE
jgi:hypothetical protein